MAEVKLADLRTGACNAESKKQGDCLSIEYGSLKEMQLSWLWPCSYPSEYLKSNTSWLKGSSSLVFARRGISCRYESTIQKINKTEPILSINIHNAVMDFKGSFVAGFIIVQNGSMLNTCSQCFFSGLLVCLMSHLLGLGCYLPQLLLLFRLFRCDWGNRKRSLLVQLLSEWLQLDLAGLPQICY